MKNQIGMVLIITLVFLMVMSLLISSMLIVSQLSHKAAYAGQQQFMLEQEALLEHITSVQHHSNSYDLLGISSKCPASYAAFSEGVLQCELLQIDTLKHSENNQFSLAYSSVVLRVSFKKDGN